MKRKNMWSNDIRATDRYEQVREGSGPCGTGEVGTLKPHRFSVEYVIVEFVSADGWYVVWGKGDGNPITAFITRQAAADFAIAEMERTRHVDRIKVS